MKKEKEYIEPEVIKESQTGDFKKRSFNYREKKTEESFNNLKNNLHWKIFSMLLPQILGIILVFVGIFVLVYILFESPFDHIIAAIILYFMIKSILGLKKFFK